MKNERILEEIDKISELAVRLPSSKANRIWKAAKMIENRRGQLLYDRLDDLSQVLIYDPLLLEKTREKEKRYFGRGEKFCRKEVKA